MTDRRRSVPRETLEQATERAFAELARILAVASERRAKMTTENPTTRRGRAA